MTRKEFIRDAGLISISFCCGLSLLQGCNPPLTLTAVANHSHQLVVPKVSLQGNVNAIIRNADLLAPVFLSKDPEGNYRAVLMLCTHKQCELNPAGTILLCPCHGSEFSQDGKVLAPPADEDLLKYKVIETGEELLIQL